MSLALLIGITFALLLIAFHAILFRSKRLRSSGIFWHFVDYVWLGAAGVALILASIDVQRFKLTTEIDEKNAEVRAELNSIRMSASHIAIFLGGQHDKDGGQKGVEWFRNLASELEMGDGSRWGIFLAENYNDLVLPELNPGENPSRYVANEFWKDYRIDPMNTDPILLQKAKQLLLELDNLSQQRSEIHHLEEQLKSTDTSFKVRWPWFLCLALALRLTKVTADLLRYKQSLKEESQPGACKVKKEEPLISSDAP